MAYFVLLFEFVVGDPIEYRLYVPILEVRNLILLKSLHQGLHEEWYWNGIVRLSD